MTAVITGCVKPISMPMNISTPAMSAMTGLRPLTTNEVMVTTSLPPVSGNPATTAAMAEPMMAVM